ncbi:hypothetical protein ACLOJK_013563 [Asimina triloba]
MHLKLTQSLENEKLDLQVKIATEENGNDVLQASLERRKQDLYERLLTLEQDISFFPPFLPIRKQVLSISYPKIIKETCRNKGIGFASVELNLERKSFDGYQNVNFAHISSFNFKRNPYKGRGNSIQNYPSVAKAIDNELDFEKLESKSIGGDDVAKLRDQLERERDVRAGLEYGLKMPLEESTVLPDIDDKIRKEIKETALAEAEISNLEQKIADLHVQIDQQRQQDRGPNALSGAFHESASTQDSFYTSDNHPAKEEPDSNNKDGEKSSATSIVLPPDIRNGISNEAELFHQEQSSKEQNADSTVLTTNLPSDHLNVETQASPSSLETQEPDKQQLDLTSQNGSLGSATVSSSFNCESAVTQDPPSFDKQQSPKMQNLDSTVLTSDSSTSYQSVQTRAALSSSEYQAQQKQQPDTTIQNSTKCEGASTSSSSSHQSVKTRALPSSSEYQAPEKQQPETTLQNGTEYEGAVTSSSSNHESISGQEPQSFPKKQSPKKQHPESTGTTTNSSTGRLSVKTQLSSSPSENQTLNKQHPDSTVQNNTKFEGSATSSASKYDIVTRQDLPSLSSKLPNQKQHLNQKLQPDSPYPNRNKYGGAAPSSVSEFEKALGQNPSSYLSDKQLSSSQQPQSTTKNNKQLSNNQQTHSNSKSKSKGTSTGEESTKVGSSKKSSGKGEGTSGSHAMSRLTNLLNYMKERRSLDEAHNQDASKTHASEGPSLGHPSETTNSR